MNISIGALNWDGVHWSWWRGQSPTIVLWR